MVIDVFGLLVVVFVTMHGLTHLVYFAASWTSLRTGFGAEPWVLPGDVTIRSPLGRLWGIAGVVVMVLFLAGAVALLLRSPLWVHPTNLAVFLSFGVVVPWLRQSPRSIGRMAVFADLALMFLLALPLSQEVVAA